MSGRGGGSTNIWKIPYVSSFFKMKAYLLKKARQEWHTSPPQQLCLPARAPHTSHTALSSLVVSDLQPSFRPGLLELALNKYGKLLSIIPEIYLTGPTVKGPNHCEHPCLSSDHTWIGCLGYTQEIYLNFVAWITFSQKTTQAILTQFSPCASIGGRTECKPHLHVNLKIYQVLSIM